MICNRLETGWELLYQNAHARIAMDLLAPWRQSERPARWPELLYAACQHDNGWQEWEPGDHLTPLGTPRHFEETTMADVVRQSTMALGRVRYARLWAGLLLVEHFRTLYAPLADDCVRAMLDEQAAMRAPWRRVLGATKADVETSYELLKWADTFSLVLCCRALPFGERRIEIEAVKGVRYTAWERADGSVGVDPWPYEPDAVEVSAETYPLRRLTFESADDLSGAIAEAKIVHRTWTVRRA